MTGQDFIQSLQDFIRSLQDFDMEQLLDTDNIGILPLPVKTLLWSLTFLGALVMGYFIHVPDLQQEFARIQATEGQMKEDYRKKYREAVHLETYRAQQPDLEQSFAALRQQFPTDIPGLIEDITLLGRENGLGFTSIELQPEVTHDFYIEKPVSIVVTGSYHGLGTFVSEVAALPRIVTMHNFVIQPVSVPGTPDDHLKMQLLAKTYRYNPEQQ